MIDSYESSKPMLVQMGKDYLRVSQVGVPMGKSARFGGAHDPNPALIFDAST